MPPRKRASRTKRARKPSLVAALERPSAYDHDVASVRVAETHISWVFLTGAYAYKVKKPVKFSFLDFSTLERRRRFCEEELRLDRRLEASAPPGAPRRPRPPLIPAPPQPAAAVSVQPDERAQPRVE